MNSYYDILDQLQDEESYVQLFLTDGSTIFGLPQCIVWNEDENGWETIKSLMFDPRPYKCSVFFMEGQIESYRRVSKDELPTE